MSKRNRSRITRRDFIVAGSAGVAAVAAAPGSLFAAPTPDGAAPVSLSIGYWFGSERLAQLTDWRKPENGNNRVIDAASLPQGDFEFLRGGVQVNVVGMTASARYPGLRSLDVRAHFNANLNGGRDLIPFGAWSYRNDGMEKASPGVRFQMPVAPESGITFSIETETEKGGRIRGVRTGGALTKREAYGSISLSGEGAKLIRGVYFLAISDAPVKWSSYEFLVRKDTVTSRELVQRGLLGVAPADFPYIVMTVERGVTR